ncbi:hypothetical protein [Paraburkholderia sp. J12]|uniref:hypothetical protein n=1 Tax=Paraburkholderia sp. J12 TaxID=2805432 RepID=UPI002ABD40C9|nr:hypothetical protein [Paraburkholderia sp. J12]
MTRKNANALGNKNYLSLMTTPLRGELFAPYSQGPALETTLPAGFPIPTIKDDWAMMLGSIPGVEPVIAITMVINNTHAVNWLLDGSDPAVHKALDSWLSQGAFQGHFYRPHQRTGKYQALVLPLGNTQTASGHLIRYDPSEYDGRFSEQVLAVIQRNLLGDTYRRIMPTIRRETYCPVGNQAFATFARTVPEFAAAACNQSITQEANQTNHD